MDEALKKIMELGWLVKIYGNGEDIELENVSPAGEDLVISVSVGDFLVELKDNYEFFDAEEHACMWFGQHKGEPSSLRELLDDAEKIEEMYRELYLTAKEAME